MNAGNWTFKTGQTQAFKYMRNHLTTSKRKVSLQERQSIGGREDEGHWDWEDKGSGKEHRTKCKAGDTGLQRENVKLQRLVI